MKNTIKFLTVFAFVINLSLWDLWLSHPYIASAEDETLSETTYPYTKTFMITAYYSPLPGQSKYVTGSYSGDIRLNGNGTNGADGTPVYAGMVAAPKKYSFGTKLYIPGIGMTTVHDRGGAIVSGSGEDGSGPKHDRLDIWMGYGDKGLRRALNWGFRTVDITVYGIDETIEDNVILSDYSSEEKYNQEYFYIPDYEESSSDMSISSQESTSLFPEDLWYLSQGEDVKKLQEYLNQLGYFNGEINGYFGDDTRMAIYLFQIDKGIIIDITDLGAGHFGPATRKALEEAILNRKSDLTPKVDLGPASVDKEAVKKLQAALKLSGYDIEATGTYDEKTVEAVFKFQLDNDIVSTLADAGAGYFGPKTFAMLAQKIENLLDNGTKIATVHASDEVSMLIATKKILTPPMKTGLKSGDTGSEVRILQKELKNLSLLRIEPTGNYGESTKHAVFKFQQIYGLVTDETAENAGVFTDQTREKLNEIIAAKNYYTKKIAEKAYQNSSSREVASAEQVVASVASN